MEFNWFDRAGSYTGDLMVSDDFAPDGGNDTRPSVQSMLLRGNVFVQGNTPANHYKIWAMLNDEAPGNRNVSFELTAVYNTCVVPLFPNTVAP